MEMERALSWENASVEMDFQESTVTPKKFIMENLSTELLHAKKDGQERLATPKLVIAIAPTTDYAKMALATAFRASQEKSANSLNAPIYATTMEHVTKTANAHVFQGTKASAAMNSSLHTGKLAKMGW